jgi:hypothetical protein
MATYQFSGVGRIDFCAECPFCQTANNSNGSFYYCEISDNEVEFDINTESRPTDCPLVEVKED